MEKRNRNYWRPLWNGLVMDSEGKHFRRMKSSVWLFLYLVLKANPKTGLWSGNCREISREMGVSTRTIKYWFKNLKEKGYLSTQKQKNGLFVCVKKWKGFSDSNQVSTLKERDKILPQPGLERGKGLPHRGAKIGHFKNKKVEKILYSKGKTRERNLRNIYDIDINNIDSIDKQNEFNSFSLTKKKLLARDLAEGLEDEEGFNFYLSVCRKYPEEFLRKIYSQVKQIPKNKIKKSKGALFNYLIQEYEKRKKNHLH